MKNSGQIRNKIETNSKQVREIFEKIRKNGTNCSKNSSKISLLWAEFAYCHQQNWTLTVCNDLVWFKRQLAIVFGHAGIQRSHPPTKLQATNKCMRYWRLRWNCQDYNNNNEVSDKKSYKNNNNNFAQSNLHIIPWQIVSLPGNIFAALCLLRQIVGAVVAYRIRVGLIVEIHECGRYGLHLARCLMQMLHLLSGRLPRVRVIQWRCRAHRFIWATCYTTGRNLKKIEPKISKKKC